MKSILVYIGIALFFVAGNNRNAEAQIVDGAYKRTNIHQKKPMPLPAVREADVFWSKKIWRIIDLREKMNLSMYYPTSESDERKNLISVLFEGIENEQITPYDARLDAEFKTPLTYDQVKEQFGAETSTEERIDFDTGEREEVVVQGEIRPNEIKQFMVKEEWYFDKQSSSLNVRIIGICPIREYIRPNDPTNEVQRTQVFWVYYPQARDLLAKSVAMNPYNGARSLSYDDLFVKRLFNSYVVKESNIYNNRFISSYLSGREAMLESKRIENEIFNFEQDLWAY